MKAVSWKKHQSKYSRQSESKRRVVYLWRDVLLAVADVSRLGSHPPVDSHIWYQARQLELCTSPQFALFIASSISTSERKKKERWHSISLHLSGRELKSDVLVGSGELDGAVSTSVSDKFVRAARILISLVPSNSWPVSRSVAISLPVQDFLRVHRSEVLDPYHAAQEQGMYHSTILSSYPFPFPFKWPPIFSKTILHIPMKPSEKWESFN